MQIKIKDRNSLRLFNYEALTCMEWVFLTESLIGVIAKADEELAFLMRLATGLETAEIGSKDMEFTSKLLKGVLKAISEVSEEKKTEIYNRIFKGFTYQSEEGGVLFVSCETINSILQDPHNFYVLVYQCLKAHYEPFFLLARDRIKESGENQTTNL